MFDKNFGSEYWNDIHKKIKRHHYYGIMSDYKRYCYNRLFKKWFLNIKEDKILVTDLFDEAYHANNVFYTCNRINKNTVGIDISKIVLEKTRANLNAQNTLVCDIRQTPFKDESFDLILSPSTLDHFSEEDLVRSLNEMAKLLTLKGKIIVSLHNKLNMFLHFYMTKFIKRPLYRLDAYSIKDFKRILKKTNLKIVKQSAICHLPFPLISRSIYYNLMKIKKTKKILIKSYKFFENLENTKLKNYTGELLVFELNKKYR